MENSYLYKINEVVEISKVYHEIKNLEERLESGEDASHKIDVAEETLDKLVDYERQIPMNIRDNLGLDFESLREKSRGILIEYGQYFEEDTEENDLK